MKYLCSVILFFLCLASYAIAEETRVFMDSYINGQPVKLIFDTGAEGPVLFRQAAKRLNLSLTEPPSDVKREPGKVKFALAEECKFQLTEGGTESSIQFAVADIPEFLNADFDGVMGWGGIKHLMIEMDPCLSRVMIREKIDFEKSEWKYLDIRTDLNVLVVETSNVDASQDRLLIDTGSPDGLRVKKERWQQFIDNSNKQNISLSAIYYPGTGLVVNMEMWIHEVNFGGLPFHEIPVKMGMEAIPWLTKEGVDGILGMWGLSCYSWIVDGPAGKIYFKENDLMRIPEKYEYNRLGAVFVPKDIQTGNALIAHVIENGPAWRAGIRDGDELLKIGQLDATKWRTDPTIMPLSQHWEKPAGTEINLLLLRDDKKVEIKVTLEEIFKQK